MRRWEIDHEVQYIAAIGDFNTTVASIPEEDVQKFLHPFFLRCSEFAWRWVIFRLQGPLPILGPEKSYKVYDARTAICIDKQRKEIDEPITAEVWPLWPALIDSHGTVIAKGRVYLSTSSTSASKAR